MSLNLFDTHINLHGEHFDEDRDEVLVRARSLGVRRFISICDRLENFQTILDFSKKHEDMWCTVGVHPHYAKEYPDLLSARLAELSEDKTVCAIGETGLDQHYGYSGLDAQIASFKKHIHAAQETGLPIVVHSRDADDVMGDILEEEMKSKPFSLLMHCYTSGQRLADRAKELGAFFSVSGIFSFKKAEEVRSVIASVPKSQIILETDCPYLAPTPHRGKRNEPAFLVDVCRAYASSTGEDEASVAELTTQNAMRLFGRVK